MSPFKPGYFLRESWSRLACSLDLCIPTDKGFSNGKAMCPCVNVSSERISLKMPCRGLAR